MTRATGLTAVQLGVETTPGARVAANRQLFAVGVTPGIRAESRQFRSPGRKFPGVSRLNKEWTEASISGQAAYNDLAYLLSSLLVRPTPAQQGGTAAYLWTFVPSQNTLETVATYTMEYGSSQRAVKWTYGLVSELSLKFTRDEVTVDGTVVGRALTDGITMTASPTVLAAVPVLPTQVSVFMDSTPANIGTTRLTRVFNAEFSVANRYNLVWPVDANQPDWAAHVELAPEVQLKLLAAADAQGMGPLSAMRVGETRYIRIQAVGPLIASTYYYTLTLDMAGVVQEVADFSDNDGVYAVEWTFTPVWDGTLNKAFSVALINTVTAL